ncbi:hypothetical protein [Kutzneria buriramensis]|uniref:hypothetical protein n=1 Tax=Kutzneria buriramensis TaxID=1045776 RepID=UPI0011C15836|nr:hypothetical protein [Kutzneria buriramensis]
MLRTLQVQPESELGSGAGPSDKQSTVRQMQLGDRRMRAAPAPAGAARIRRGAMPDTDIAPVLMARTRLLGELERPGRWALTVVSGTRPSAG